MTRYLRRTYRVSFDAEEEVVAALWEQGTLGLETLEAGEGERTILAYFAEPGPGHSIRGMGGPASHWAGVPLVDEVLVEQEDWLARYRELARPIELGDRLVVDPREPGEAPPPMPPGRTLLRLPARTAFGTGSHASTRLALQALEALPVSGWQVLDVGTGSGILSFAARRFGASGGVGFDLDAAAVMVACGNRERNGIDSVALFAGPLAALSPGCAFDLALVNVLPAHILGEVAGIVERVRPGGALVVSGFLVAEAPHVLSAWEAAGTLVRRRLEEEEWAAALLERPSS